MTINAIKTEKSRQHVKHFDCPLKGFKYRGHDFPYLIDFENTSAAATTPARWRARADVGRLARKQLSHKQLSGNHRSWIILRVERPTYLRLSDAGT